MSLKEVRWVVDAYVERTKQDLENRRALDYSLAVMIAGFVGAAFSGKEIPSYDSLFNENKDNDKGRFEISAK